MCFYYDFQETLTEVIPRLNVIRDKLLRSQDEFSKFCDPMYLEQLKEKMSDVIVRLANTEKRLRLCKGSEVNIYIYISYIFFNRLTIYIFFLRKRMSRMWTK